MWLFPLGCSNFLRPFRANGNLFIAKPNLVLRFAIPSLGVGTKARRDESKEETEERIRKMSGAIRTLLECIGEDPDREGLLRTPERYANALMYFSKGYEENIRGED